MATTSRLPASDADLVPGPRRSRRRRRGGGCPRSWAGRGACASASPARVEGRSQAGHEEALDARRAGRCQDRVRVAREGSDCRCACESTSRSGGSSRSRRSRGAPAARLDGLHSSRGKSGAPDRCRPAGRERPPGGELGERRARRCRPGRTSKATPSCAAARAAVSGMKGAAARVMTRQASSRSPRTSPGATGGRVVAAPWRPCARLHGCSAST